MRFAVTIPLKCKLRNANIPQDHTYNQMLSLIQFAVLIWFVIGQRWLYMCNTCYVTAPILYYSCWGLVLYAMLWFLLPVVVCIGISLCSPCILWFMSWLAKQSDEDRKLIKAL